MRGPLTGLEGVWCVLQSFWSVVLFPLPGLSYFTRASGLAHYSTDVCIDCLVL